MPEARYFSTPSPVPGWTENKTDLKLSQREAVRLVLNNSRYKWKKLVGIIGQHRALEMAVRNRKANRRVTKLRERLKETDIKTS